MIAIPLDSSSTDTTTTSDTVSSLSLQSNTIFQILQKSKTDLNKNMKPWITMKEDNSAIFLDRTIIQEIML